MNGKATLIFVPRGVKATSYKADKKKDNRVIVIREIVMDCPHCGVKPHDTKLVRRNYAHYRTGELPPTYDCPNCGREWTQDEQGNWVSSGCTDIEKWSPDGKTLIEHGFRNRY